MKATLLKYINIQKKQAYYKMNNLWEDAIAKAQNKSLLDIITQVFGWDFYSVPNNKNFYQNKVHQSLMVKKETDRWIYTWFSKEEKGNTIDFCMKNFELTFVEAVIWLNNTKFTETINTEVQEKKLHNLEKIMVNGKEYYKQWYTNQDGFKRHRLVEITDTEVTKEDLFENVFKNIYFTSNTKATYAYLVKTRKISQKLVQTLIDANYIRTTSVGKMTNTVFIIKEEGKDVGCQIVGNSKAEGKDRFKKIVEYSNNSVGFNICFCKQEDVKEIYFFEGVEDMLSFMTMFQNKSQNGLFVAMMGLKKQVVKHYMDIYGLQVHYNMMTDNDKFGFEFYNRIMEDEGFKYNIRGLYDVVGGLLGTFGQSNYCKDFNDYLIKYYE